MVLPSRRQPAVAKSGRNGWSPEFRSRPERFRLLVLVFGLMLVLIAMNEARKPDTWAFLWRGQRPAEQDHGPIDTRITLQDPNDPLPGTIVVDSPGEKDDKKPTGQKDSTSIVQAPTPPSAQDPLTAQHDAAWRQIWDQLNYDEKYQLSSLLRTARRGQNASESDARRWQALVNKLDQFWNDYFRVTNGDTLLPENSMPPEERRARLQILTELEKEWRDRFKPAFESAVAPREWPAEQRSVLNELQRTVDKMALEDVSDDTVWRASERSAWFRLLEKLQQTSPSELSRQSLGRVGFLQIYRQSDEYRGKIVTIRGTVRLVYRVAAPTNDLGVEEYCLFWIQPEDGSNRPIVVYALNPPKGFPRIDRDPKQIREPVEVTGFFFKRWIYRAADGLNSVPLLVASVPTWIPAESPRPAAGPISWPLLSITLGAVAVVVLGLVLLVKRSARSSAVVSQLRAETDVDAQQTAHWDDLPATPSIEESLRQLEEEQSTTSLPASTTALPGRQDVDDAGRPPK